MPRLLLDGEWFEPLSPHAILDTEYEELLLEQAALLYPAYLVVRVHIPVRNRYGTAQPHLALVDTQYREWWLVLLEVGPSPTIEFVRQQVRILREHRYGKPFASTVASRDPRLDAVSFQNLAERDAPNVCFILGHPPVPEVSEPFSLIGIAEIFESTASHRRILRINGEHPLPPLELVTVCRRDPMVPGLLFLNSPEKVGRWTNDQCEIEFGDNVTTWRRRDECISPEGACLLPAGVSDFNLLRTHSGRLKLVPQTKGGSHA